MKRTLCVLGMLLMFSGMVSAGTPIFYSKLDLPIYVYRKPVYNPAVIDRLYIGSDKSYAAEPRVVQITGKSLNLGFAAAALLQPAGPLVAAGFLLVGLINAKDLVAAVNSKPARRSEWSFIWARKKY